MRTSCFPFRCVDTDATLDALSDWTDEDSTRNRILVDNPALLYGFAATDHLGAG